MLEEYAREKLGKTQKWEQYNWRVLGDDDFRYAVIEGCIPDVDLLGEQDWSRRVDHGVIAVTMVDLVAWMKAWQERTGLCAECHGTGEVFASWDYEAGTEMKVCEVCQGTGKFDRSKQGALFDV